MHCRKEHMFRSERMFKILLQGIDSRHSFWEISKHPLAARSFRFLRAAAHSTSSALCSAILCLQKIPSLCRRFRKFVFHAEKHRFGHGVVVSKVCYGIVECVFFPFAMSTIAMCQDWAFSNSGWKWGCQPIQLPMFAKCDALPKGDLPGTCLFKESIPHSFWEFQASTSYQEA